MKEIIGEYIVKIVCVAVVLVIFVFVSALLGFTQNQYFPIFVGGLFLAGLGSVTIWQSRYIG